MKSTKFLKTFVLAVSASISLIAGMERANADVITVNFPEVNYSTTGGYPTPVVIWSTQNYTIPTGDTILSATFSGTWGNTSEFHGSTAETELFINGLLVSDTTALTPDPYDNIVPFSFTYTDFSSLESGSATLSFIETTGNVVRLSDTTLVLDVVASDVPEPASLLLFGLGLAAVAVTYRKAKQ